MSRFHAADFSMWMHVPFAQQSVAHMIGFCKREATRGTITPELIPF